MAHKNTSLYTFGSIDEDINEDACISYCKAENDENNKVASFSFKSNNKNLTNNTNSKTKTIQNNTLLINTAKIVHNFGFRKSAGKLSF